MLKVALLLAATMGPAYRAPPARPAPSRPAPSYRPAPTRPQPTYRAPPRRETPGSQPTDRPPPHHSDPPAHRQPHQGPGPGEYRQEPKRGGHNHLWTAGAGLLGYWLGQRQSQPAPGPEYPYRPDVPEPAPHSQPALPAQPLAQTPYAPTFDNSPFDRDAWCRNMPFEMCPPWLQEQT